MKPKEFVKKIKKGKIEIVNERLKKGEREKEILELIEKKGPMCSVELAETLNLSPGFITNTLRRLERKNILIAGRNSGKKVYYELKKRFEENLNTTS